MLFSSALPLYGYRFEEHAPVYMSGERWYYVTPGEHHGDGGPNRTCLFGAQA